MPDIPARQNIAGFEGWYMHAYMYKHPDIDTYLYIGDHEWFIQTNGKIKVKGTYVEQNENKWGRDTDPYNGTQYKYDFITEDGLIYRCHYEVKHGHRSRDRGHVDLSYKGERSFDIESSYGPFTRITDAEAQKKAIKEQEE